MGNFLLNYQYIILFNVSGKQCKAYVLISKVYSNYDAVVYNKAEIVTCVVSKVNNIKSHSL